MALDSSSVFASTAARDIHRVYQLRLAATVCSGLSVTASIVAFYWFFRMTKLFRHRLIMLLVYGDVMRSAWFLVFSVHSLVRGPVKTDSRFCQTSGFFIQYGTETSDYAVLIVAIHSALQIFRPAARGMADGLYGYRSYVFTGAFVVPGMMSGLTFVNTGHAYESLGVFCQLPIRPFWYRLALAWIPRYLIAFIILSLAVSIYAYVGFRSYPNLTQSDMTPVTTALGSTITGGDPEPAVQRAQTEPFSNQAPDHLRRASSIAHDVLSSPHRGSAVAFGPTTYAPAPLVPKNTTATQSLKGSSMFLPLKRTTSARPAFFVVPPIGTTKLAISALDLQGPLSPRSQPIEDPMSTLVHSPVPTEAENPLPRRSPSPPSPVQRHLARQRRRIHRQLRLMFVYPLVYIIMWTIPFIQNVLNYNNFYANHPLWFTRIGMTICLTSMGFVDSLIFSMREKPWRSIADSDGTVWGSLAIWRRSSLLSSAASCVTDSESRKRSLTESAARSAGARVRSSVRTSASNDYSKLAAGRARQRLELEKDERLAAMTARLERGSEVYTGVVDCEDARGSGNADDDGDGDEKGKGKGKEKMVGEIV